ncbi:MAG: alpha/beta fold hydrolase [Lapillicoccus sp.]
MSAWAPGRRMRAPGRRMRAAALVLLVTALGGTHTAAPARADTGAPTTSAEGAEQSLTVPVGAEPDGATVTLDATLFTPAPGGQHPAVLLAHGFGGSKADLTDQAHELQGRGYVVLTWSARGFAGSGGRIHLDDPAYEVADARALVDLLATRPEVRLDAPGDPRVGVAGGSYGGALALMLGATDRRVDAVAASITWNDLAQAFFPQQVTTGAAPSTPAALTPIATPGPFKQLWASTFFQSANAGAARATTGAAPAATNPVCGRFDPTVCRLFLAVSESGTPSPELLDLLRAHSPAAVIGGLKAPTYLVQGMADSLFGIAQADATARSLAAQGTPVAVRWMDGGHDGPSTTAASDEESVRTWLAHYLPTDGAAPGAAGMPLPLPAFVYAAPVPRRQRVAPLLQTGAYAGSATTSSVPLQPAGPTSLLAPPGGEPAAITGIPGGAGLLATTLPTYSLAALPGQSVAFDSAVLAQQTRIVGAPRVRLTITSTAPSSTLYLSLWQVTAGVATFPRRLVAPVTVPTTPGQPTTVDVDLPAATWTFEAGSALRLLVTATDSAYAGPRAARADRLAVDATGLVIPTVAGTTLSAESDADAESIGVAIAIGVVLLVLLASWWWRRRRRREHPYRPDLADVPLVISHLVKTYRDGHRAVDDVSWRAERGQVVGLLGPNGAGKTTTLRMVMGLIRPDSGTVHVLGRPIDAGAPVLARVGALIEGPGFLPHLTGLQNLHAYWAATGRPPPDAAYADVLEVAALGGAVDRPVRSYSHGMKQRLGIAQAMLGMPDVLVLDEPTNGLDPPQIAAMRPILHRYASTGRTVVVSSHLLAEVELTCSHVIVMHAGRVVTSGTVAELVDSADTTVVLLGPGSDIPLLRRRLAAAPGITEVDVEEDPVEPKVVITADIPRADVVRAVAETGVDIVGVTSRKHLEDVFLGVIADAQGASAGASDDAGPRSLTDRLRQVRAR